MESGTVKVIENKIFSLQMMLQLPKTEKERSSETSIKITHYSLSKCLGISPLDLAQNAILTWYYYFITTIIKKISYINLRIKK